MNRQAFTIVFVFLLMGVADAMGPLSAAVKEEYSVSQLTATLLPFFVFIAFAVFSVPGGILAGRIGKRNLLLLGLGLNAAAMLIPSVTNPEFGVLLACIFVLGIGTTFLQVAANPIMRDVSEEGNYSRNLSFAQGVKGLGSTASAYIVSALGTLALLANMGWRGAFPVFCALMVLAFIMVLLLKVNETQPEAPPSIGSSLALLKEPIFALAVLGIFLYVGAEVCMTTFTKPTLTALGFTEEKAARYGPTAFLLLLTIGRLSGGVALNVMSAVTCFRLSAILGLVGVSLITTGTEALTIAGIVAAGLGFANIWPTLFSITVEHRPERANELSGLMCMAISGGALVPLVMARLADADWGPMAFVVPAACFAYLTLISLWQRQPAPASGS